MKFLEDEKLAQLTADLTDATLAGCHGGSGEGTSRIINGRIEAYTMKRVSSDKKYAHALGEKYIKEIDQVEEEMAKFQKSLGLEDTTAHEGGGSGGRAGSIDEWKRHKFGVNKSETTKSKAKEDKKSSTPKDESRDSSTSPKLTGKSGPGGSRAGRKPDKTDPAKGSRRRSQSVDIGGIAKAAAASSGKVTILTEPTEPSRTSSSASSTKGVQPLTSIMKPKGGGRYRSSSFDTSRARASSTAGDTTLHSHGYFSNSSLGDFHEMGTRRLMTDLILTLNASFPDYDFGSVRPDHFIRLASATVAVNRVNERLSEFAATLPANTHGYGRSMMDGAGFSYGYGASSSRDNGSVFLQKLWGALDDVIVLNDCEVYSYVPPAGDNDDDPLGFLTETLAPGGAGGTATSNGTASAAAITSTASNISAAGPMGSSALGPISGAAAASQSAMTESRNSANTAIGASMPLWTFNYFFVNKSLKRIVLFACVQTMQNESMDIDDDDMDDVSGGGANRILSPSRIAASADGTTPSRYGYDDVDDVDSPPTGIPRGSDGGTRRQLLGASASGMTDGGGVSGYYSVSSTDARTDDEYDTFDTGALAQDVSRPATPGTPVSVS